MEDSIDSIIVCGGKGSRMKNITQKCGCKSLVPILGIPAIGYLTDTIRKVVPNSRIILAIDNPKLKPKFEEIYNTQGIKNYQIYEGLPRGPVQAFYEAGGLCRSDKVLIFFGNQLVSDSHLKKLLSHNSETLVLSGFKSLSENNCKIATIDNKLRVLDVTRYDCLEHLNEGEVYLDVPYVVPNNFFSMETFPEIKRLFVKTPMIKTILSEANVVVEKSEFPPEFHFMADLGELERCVSTFFGETIRKLGGKYEC